MKHLIFLCIATCIFFLSVIVLNVAPSINGLVGKGFFVQGIPLYPGFADYPCSWYTDEYNDIKDGVKTHTGSLDKDKYLDQLKDGKSDCLRKKAYVGLEYSAFIIDVIFSFICAMLGLLLYSGNNIGKIVGLIGLASGGVGFVLTFVYIIYSGIVFNNDVALKDYSNPDDPYSSAEVATKSDGAVLEWKDNKYVCIFYDKDNKDKLYRKYSNYGVKYLNYYRLNEKDKDEEYYKYTQCAYSFRTLDWDDCKKYDEGTRIYGSFTTIKEIRDTNGNKKGECDKLYVNEFSGTSPAVSSSLNIPINIFRKKLYDYWVLTIVFGCFIFVLDIGLAIFGFLIFKDSSGSSGAVTIK